MPSSFVSTVSTPSPHTEEASQIERGRRFKPVLNSSSLYDTTEHENNQKTLENIEKPSPSAADTKTNAFSITSEGPRYFKVVRGSGARRQLDLPVTIENPETKEELDLVGLLDTGCTGACVHRDLVRRANLTMHPFEKPIPVYNADGTLNVGGCITHYVRLWLRTGDHRELIQFLVTDLGKADLFLGHEWIAHHNPSIDWQKKIVEFNRCPPECQHVTTEGEHIFMLNTSSYLHSRKEYLDTVHIRAKTSVAMEIAIEQHHAQRERTFEELVPEQYHDFRDVFLQSTFDVLPEHRPYDHVIELLPDAKPYCGKVYPMTLDEQDALDAFLEENLRTGRIHPSKSPWGAPFFFVKKKDGKLRPVQDYRKLNAMTKKNKYPLPLMSELLDKLKGAKYFTKLDIRWGYNNIRMADGDEEKAAFLTNRGLYEPLVMFFGLSNSPSTFQMMMNDIFRDLVLKGKVIVYLDDILIFSNSLTEHRVIVRQVLQLLRENKLTVKPEKCEFEVQETEYLGHIIAPGIIKMDPAKVTGVTSWPTPTSKREVQGFLGFANFYRRFIQGFSSIAAPLNRLTGLVEWIWTEAEQQAFDRIKTAITTAPVLAVPNDHDPFKVECDASKFALGAELAQLQNGQWHTIAFLSKSLSPAERNYEIYDREMLALITALDEWRHFLKGAQTQFEIHSDHKNLEYFRKPQRLNPRQARWVLTLQDYDFTLTHRPGRTMGKPDALSRRPDHDIGDDGNEDITMLKPEWFRPIQVDSVEKIQHDVLNLSTHVDDFVTAQLGVNGDFEKTEDGLIYRKGKLVIPNDRALRGRIIAAHHDSVSAGHPGRDKTQELVYRSYWWPSMRKDVRAYVTGCSICQRTKIDHRRRAAPLHPNPVPDQNWEYMTTDMITHLPDSHGHNAILVFVDMKSKDFVPIPCTDELTSEGWANLFINHVYAHHGLPQRVYSDRGSVFVSAFIRDLYRKLGIVGNPSTAYHPQTDGQTERVNQEIENYLRIFVNHRQDDWADWLPLAAFTYRNRKHSATGYSPFYMTHGYHPFTGVETKKKVKAEAVEQFVTRMKGISQQASLALAIAKAAMKRKYDKHKRAAEPYKVGDLVFLDSFHITSKRPHKKLEDKRYGPFPILARVGPSAYRLKLPRQWRAIHPVFNEVQLTPARQPVFPNQTPPGTTVPDILDRTPEPEEVLDSKVVRGGLQYLVKWKDKPRSENTWQKRTDLLKTSRPLIDSFHTRNPTAPRMPTITIAPQSRWVTVAGPEQRSWDHWSARWDNWHNEDTIRNVTFWTMAEIGES